MIETAFAEPSFNQGATPHKPETNAVNFFWLPDAQIVDPDAFSVAYAMRASDAAVFDEKTWSLAIDESHLNPAFGWQLLGYDVSDSWLGLSGLYALNWEADDTRGMFHDLKIVFTRYGLIADEAVAVEVAARLTPDVISEHHSPFYPVRIWVQIKPTGAPASG